MGISHDGPKEPIILLKLSPWVPRGPLFEKLSLMGRDADRLGGAGGSRPGGICV